MKTREIVHFTIGHYYRGTAFQQVICGKSILDTTPSTTDRAKVTCKLCLKQLAKQPA